jgi:hypothetical protein
MSEEKQESRPAIEDSAHALISSRRVEGTKVYNKAGEKLGTIHSVMINKTSGHVVYALLSFGSFLGLGGNVYPVPWPMLDYDPDRDGYVVELTREQIENAPSLRLDEADRPHQRSEEELVYAYYGQVPHWGGAPY